MNITEFVESAVTSSTVERVGLDSYKDYIPRSVWETKMVNKIRSYTGTVIDVNVLFSLEEMWEKDPRVPALAISYWKWPLVRFYREIWSTPGKFFGPPVRSHLMNRTIKFNAPSLRNLSTRTSEVSATARVPMVPSRFANLVSNDAYILFDASWSNIQEKVITQDPFLLRRISKTLFEITAHWDLTPNEISLMNSLRSIS
jgi:hypothetical protein